LIEKLNTRTPICKLAKRGFNRWCASTVYLRRGEVIPVEKPPKVRITQ